MSILSRTFVARISTLAVVVALGSLMSGSAHAAILRSSNGAPVLTRDGNCVITNWEGSDECAAAKAEAGIGGARPRTASTAASAVYNQGAVYFAFNKATLTARAKHQLDRLADKLKPHQPQDGGKQMGRLHHRYHHWHHRYVYEMPTLTIVGYADRIGNAVYNQKLAMRRAEAVRDYLIGQGVRAKKIELRSLGKTAPRADCSADLPRAKLINCLQEDRRVEIEVTR